VSLSSFRCSFRRAWLENVRRLLKPGAYAAIMTGDGGVQERGLVLALAWTRT
jgi:hypothetical protein